MTQAERMPVAVGDIHGRLDLLELLLEKFPERRLVFLGDLTDRGSESRAVVARVRGLVEEGRAVCCLGNHDEMLIHAAVYGHRLSLWDANGGGATLDSYGQDWAALMIDGEWMQANLKPWHTEGHVLFAHAMRPHEDQPDLHLWGRPTEDPLVPLAPGLTHSVHGHSIMQACPFPVRLADESVAWFIDTGAFHTGRLCGLDTETMQATVVEVFKPVPVPV